MTQATLSRDIRDLGLVKRSADGAYQQQGAEPQVPPSAGVALQQAMAEYASGVACVQQLIVVRTGAGPGPAAGAGHRPREARRGRRHAGGRRHDPRHFAGRPPREGAGEAAGGWSQFA